MPHAYVHLPPQAHYRRDAFIDGFARLGFVVRTGQPLQPLNAGDVAVVWNKTARSRQTIEMAHEGNAALIVAENGYYSRPDEHQRYALAIGGHNGSGWWYVGDDSRLAELDIPFKPFRQADSKKIVIAAQRGIGSALMRSPHNWERLMARKLRGWDVHVRLHPGTEKPKAPLLDDLEDARALVVWSSNCATAALVAGVPTFFDALAIVTYPCARRFDIQTAFLASPEDFESQRHDAFSKMAWAQWTLAEIKSGEPLKLLMDVHAGRVEKYGSGRDL